MELTDNSDNSFARQQVSASSKLNDVKTSIADKLKRAANVVAKKATDPEMQRTNVGRYAGQVSNLLDSSADYVRDLNINQVKSDLRQQVRQNPGRCLLIAGALGLVVGALVRRR